MWLASPGKGINEEVGIRTIQWQIRQGGCKAVQRSMLYVMVIGRRRTKRRNSVHSYSSGSMVNEDAHWHAKEAMLWKVTTEDRGKAIRMFSKAICKTVCMRTPAGLERGKEWTQRRRSRKPFLSKSTNIIWRFSSQSDYKGFIQYYGCYLNPSIDSIAPKTLNI